MLVNLDRNLINNKVVAVALSGGSDSMALLHYMFYAQKLYSFKLIALNVEHGIRGEDSVKDTIFCIDYCKSLGVKILTYKVDAVKYAKDNKLTLEQSARALRYECFYNAIKDGKCDLIATAHHRKDNFESVLFNLFRGTGLKGLIGIAEYENKIIRPLLKTDKTQILEYIKEYDIPYVTDQTNFDQKYSRNYLRHTVIPAIEKEFPFAEKNISVLSEIVKEEDAFLDEIAKKHVLQLEYGIKILNGVPKAVFARALIHALKTLGIKKDWESTHIKRAQELFCKQVGKTEDLLSGIIAVREYDGILIADKQEDIATNTPFKVGSTCFLNETLVIEHAGKKVELKSGLFGDLDKIPKSAIIRTYKNGDVFKAYKGKTKSLSDYFTDKKIPLTLRKSIPLLAYENEILVVFGYAVADKIKVDETTKNIIKFTKE